MRISMIVAMAMNRIIGAGNQMPWHLPADLKHFKQVTLGKPVVMGRKTFESIGRPLPGRTNIVITRDASFRASGIEIVTSPEEALDLAEELGVEELMIIGGGAIYRHFLPLCERLYLTEIKLDVEGDTRFPDYRAEGRWKLLEEQHYQADSANPYPMVFKTLQRA
ncbi:type 3 dihydrofolate reductase [Bowmanella dokdonensis]|uniref:Dihydrofolate reductase n=1 Tax=Bowmanella dokdonensis TaxID=751969 RepID=A0A939DPF6_9ALTE|nr:type 3 dihydrofolate reductase [Bowmanella dokdonensis]MBN7825521.1 type 3 dihydrofolate reductase [Bowmanella dokdonensis]